MAVDGPSASGKSTVSRAVARSLGVAYVDSGSLYRAVTWRVLQRGLDPTNRETVAAWLPELQVESRLEDEHVKFLVDGEDPGSALRTSPVVDHVSDVAAMPAVRRFVVDRLRETARFGSLVMEGRDIGTVVLPEARWKFFLDADPDERARRRHREQEDHPQGLALTDVKASLSRRDQKDSTRTAAPLQVAEGATVVNTTGMSIDTVVERIASTVRAAAPSP